MSTKILFLDDMPGRVQLLRHGEEIFYARNSEQFADWLLTNGTPDIISFDHDLSLEHYTASGGYMNPNRAPSGTDCARWCIEKGFIPKMVIVHSWNPDGAKRIAECFKNCSCKVIVRMFNPQLFMPRVPHEKH